MEPFTPFTPQYPKENLAQHSHRVELRGAPSRLSWPGLCANCGSPADERVAVTKVFDRALSKGDADGYRIVTVRVPFCAACALRHSQLSPTMTASERMASYFRHPFVLAPALPGGAAVFALWLAIEDAPDARSLIELLVAAVFALIAMGIMVGLRRQTAHLRVRPQTEITRACDFSDDVGTWRQRRIYSIRNKAFADAFIAANRDRVWTGANEARSRQR